MLSGDVEPARGKVKRGRTVRLAFLTQEVRELERLADTRVVDAVREVRETTRLGDREVTASQAAERLGFTGGRQRTFVRDLSGGERRRLRCCGCSWTSRTCCCSTSRRTTSTSTRSLRSRTCSTAGPARSSSSRTTGTPSSVCATGRLALLGDGALRDLPGGVDEYLRLRAASLTSSDPRPAGAAAPVTDAATQRTARKDMARIERRLQRIEVEVTQAHDTMAAQATDHVAVGKPGRALRALHAERDDLEAQWLEAADALD
ncbi:hypothetical protein GCM10025868_15130 [Angustibacter aerolatus]|uniref:ABC transporter Uup C-terminal domain-containing protein n=1 Tax=Angustibacter aerolatus TaxID=1162965 RepID=A0ABQ6JDN4_9ACTN|nr:hypothetical protein GCM10025868_15130 [Angustibacter aerolatus]